MDFIKGFAGWILFNVSLLVLLIFLAVYYIPAIQNSTYNLTTLNVAFIVGLGCGIAGAIGWSVKIHK